ncbi:MAG: hypothetical protein JKX84_09105 [Flavobacteriales bacterium]|nr:hypothetical protein [Flavobacteriales bacterium]
MEIEEYIKAEVQLHIACQMLSLTGINLVPKQADDSHTTAVWNSDKGIIVGREFELNGNNYQVFVDPLDFALGFIKNGEETERFPMDGLFYMQTVEPWKKWLTEAGFSGELNLKLHYELPDNDLYKFESFSKPSNEILNEWVKNRTLANNALAELTEMIGAPSDINIWSHHFDTGTYYELHKTQGETDRSIGAGFGVADSMVSEPYFYIYPWHKDKKIDYADVPKLENGRWIIKNWEGAVLPLSELENDPQTTVREFYETASNYLKDKLKET